MRIAMAMPSPTSMTPAPSPGPTSTHGASVGNRRRWMRDDLYEQCSDHITANIASSSGFGARPRIRSIDSASSSVNPNDLCSGAPSSTGLRVRGRTADDYHFPFWSGTVRDMPAKKASRAMSSAHKEALALGRNQSRAVRVYLEALEANKP